MPIAYLVTCFWIVCRSLSPSFLLLCVVSATGAVTGGVLQALKGRLSYRNWVLWDCRFALSVLVYVSSRDSSYNFGKQLWTSLRKPPVLGFCWQICAQFEILKHRLQRMVKSSHTKHSAESLLNNAASKSDKLSEHISHHLRIVIFVKNDNVILCAISPC